MDFEVKMTSGLLYDYMLRQAYTGFSGWLGVLSGILIISLYFIEGRFSGNLLTVAAGLVIILYTPWSLFTRSKKQMLLNPAFKKPLHYTVNEEGIRILQGEQTDQAVWEQIYKVVSTGKSIIVYTSRYNAWIFPRKDLGEQTDKLIGMIKAHMPPARVKIRKI